MADPFSIVGLVGATLKGVLAAKDFIDTIQRAPRSIKTLGDELSAIAGLLRELGYLADGSDELDMNRIVREPLANCRKVSKQIEKLIQPYVKTTGGITKWGRFAFGFKEGDVLQLQRDLSACKQNLTLAVASADLATTRKVVRGMRRFQNHFGITSSFVAGSDIDERRHEHIKTWMLETETVVEEEEETTLDASGGSYKAVRTMPAQYKDNNYNQTRVAVLSELDRPSSNFTYMQDHRVEQEEDKSKVEVKVKEKPREENASFLGLGKKNEGPKTTHIFRLNELQLVDLSQLASDYVKRLSAL